MPLSFGFLAGWLILGTGIILFYATRYKPAAKVVMWVGLFITIATFVLIVLAANSQM